MFFKNFYENFEYNNKKDYLKANYLITQAKDDKVAEPVKENDVEQNTAEGSPERNNIAETSPLEMNSSSGPAVF